MFIIEKLHDEMYALYMSKNDNSVILTSKIYNLTLYFYRHSVFQ